MSGAGPVVQSFWPTTGTPGGEPGYLYEWVAKDMAARILSGEIPFHAPIPNERRLAADYGVSLGTARHATRILRKQGLVVTVKGKGTYVIARGNQHGS